MGRRTTLGIVMLGAAAPAWTAMAAVHHAGSNTELVQKLAIAQSGDVIQLEPGVYNVAIDFLGRDLVIESADPGDPAILDGTDLGTTIVRVSSGESPDATLRNLVLRNGRGVGSTQRKGGAVYVMSSCLTVEGCRFLDNDAHVGGAVYLSGALAWFRDCSFEGNTSYGLNGIAGAAIAAEIAQLEVERCRFVGNAGTGFGYGGAVMVAGWSANFSNCLFAENTGLRGGAIYSSGCDVTLTNCTLVSNSAPTTTGGAIYQCSSAASLVATNTLFWNNWAPTRPDIRRVGGPVYASHCGFSSPDEIPADGENNAADDPLLVGLDAGDYRLSAQSPYRNQGVPDFELGGDLDLVWNDRIIEGQIDRGAYEFVPETVTCYGDIDGNGDVGFLDLVAVMTAWGSCVGCVEDVNGDGLVGMADLADILSNWGPCAN